MNRTTIVVAFGLALAAALPTAPAQAQLTRTFVAPPPIGNDSNPCTITLPCRFLQRALTQTAPGGEIAILGTAGYNNGTYVAITQAVSIVNPGGFEAGIIVPSGGPGFQILANPGDAVFLRGLTIEGAGVGSFGIQFYTGQSLAIENCIIRHLHGDGIDFGPNATSILTVSNSLVADNTSYGISIFHGGSGAVTAVFNHVEVNNNAYAGIIVNGEGSGGSVQATVYDSVAAGNGTGISFHASGTISNVAVSGNQTGILVDATGQAGSTMNVAIESSTVSNNSANGITAQSSSGDIATVVVRNSIISNNQNGVSSNPGGSIVLAHSAFTGNSAKGVLLNGGPISSYGDNNVYLNGLDLSGALTPLTTH